MGYKRTLRWRFEHAIRKEENGCWIWTKAKDKDGYGVTQANGKYARAHRVSFHLYRNFDLNSKMQILHKNICNNKSCVNPEHLYIGTYTDNMQDYSETVTHCPKGHEYTNDNTTWYAIHGKKNQDRKYRMCKTCLRERSAERRRLGKYGSV